ncbi:hypothetical protein [Phycicoccus sonneratiae]|uniref:Lipoprotein n=1 Tax=Phycicoccus sonneratiae TaxID=2807628 RepID=A0ABS2CQG5_9MICO|nr:hypothetical protein [Phycicoccus sonneraticus]MBM6402075.1 hypothetical protein [Phycicoccus sonneraticus]
MRWAASAACAVLALGACTGEGSDDATPSASASSGGSAGPSATSSAPTTPSEIPSPATAPPTLATDAPGRQDSVLARLPGSSKTGCVEVGTQRDVRSGPMAAGNFADARAAFKASPSAAFPLYVIPVDVSDEKAALSVTVAQRDGSEAKTVKSATTQTAEQWKYHLVQLSVPAAGTWRITATSGAAKGCWDVSFTS